MNYKDTNNIGACMAPSVAETIYEHFKNTKRKETYYDLILTGDLGVYGTLIMRDYLKEKYKITLKNVMDAVTMLYNSKYDDEIAGGSGPICLPLIFFTKIKKMGYKKVLLVGSGSLHSTLSCNINASVASISHAVGIEIKEVES